MSRTRSIAIGAVGAALLVGGGVAAPAGHAASTEKNHCAKNHTKYVEALSATYRDGSVRITGHHAYFFCGKDSEFIKSRKPNAAFRVRRGAPITVLGGNDEDPNRTHSIEAKKFPHYLKNHQDENYYIYKGAALAIRSLTPGFQS